MKNNVITNVCLIIATLVFVAGAVLPNFVETTTYKVDGTNNVVTTEYSDGLGRGIQSKLRLNAVPTATPPLPVRDRVSCTFYDDAGRPKYTTKPFIDTISVQQYLPGEITDNGNIDNAVESQLDAQYPGELHRYSETAYWDDPLGRARTVMGPGDPATYGNVKTWSFGVGRNDLTLTVGTYSIQFKNGFIVSTVTFEVLDALTGYLLVNTAFTTPSYFLTVAKDQNGNFTQEIKDIFGRTLATRSDPKVSGVNDEIIAEYQYDITGKVLLEIPPKDYSTTPATTLVGNTEYEYNTLGQVITKYTPDGTGTAYTYFPDGNIQTVTTTPGDPFRRLTYVYDNFGRPTFLKEYCRNIPVSAGNVGYREREIMTWAYNDLGTVITRSVFKNIPQSQIDRITNTRGRLSAVIYSNYGAKRNYVGEIYSYDDEGRIAFKFMAIEGLTGFQETRFEYNDLQGKMTAEYCAYNGESLKKQYSYDALGRLSDSYHCTATPIPIAHYTYDDLGVLTTKGFTAVSGGYDVALLHADSRGLLTGIRHTPAKAGFDEDISQYDKAGNIKKAGYKYYTDFSGIPTTNVPFEYFYDDIYRLTAATPTTSGQVPAYGASYQYDQAGRFIKKQESDNAGANLTGYVYENNTNMLKKTSKNPTAGEEYVYDESGNLVVDFTKKLVIEYDWRNMPVAYRFYNALPGGINSIPASSNLYEYLNSKVTAGIVQLASTVVMLYDAAGNRVCKMDVKE